jgi:putative transposase
MNSTWRKIVGVGVSGLSNFRRFPSYGVATKIIGNKRHQDCGRWLDNRAKNSYQPLRRPERAMVRFRNIKTLQKFAAAHASTHNYFNHDRHLTNREIFKEARSAILAEWLQLPE